MKQWSIIPLCLVSGLAAAEGWYLKAETGHMHYLHQDGFIAGKTQATSGAPRWHIDNNELFGFAIGWSMTEQLRAEIAANYYRTVNLTTRDVNRVGGTAVDIRGDVQTKTASLQVYWDLNRYVRDWAGGRLNPYVFAGIGMARHNMGQQTMTTAGTTTFQATFDDRETDTSLVRTGLGLSYQMSPKWSVALDYRWNHMGEAFAGDMTAGSNETVTRHSVGQAGREALLGVRYHFKSCFKHCT